MSSGEPTAARVTLTPLHRVRAGEGSDAVRLQARGLGLLIGTFGVLRVRGTLDTVRLKRLPAERCWAVFLGLGFGWASARLPAAGRLRVPAVARVVTPPLPSVTAPDLQLQLTVTPPQLPPTPA
jgi:hypothetical protein